MTDYDFLAESATTRTPLSPYTVECHTDIAIQLGYHQYQPHRLFVPRQRSFLLRLHLCLEDLRISCLLAWMD
jgi:hypothetical protein